MKFIINYIRSCFVNMKWSFCGNVSLMIMVLSIGVKNVDMYNILDINNKKKGYKEI